MTIKISQLGNVAAVQGNVLIPVVSNITGTPTTVKANVDQLQNYILSNAGNITPLASNTYSLGNSTTWWKDLWISNTTIYIGGVALATAGGKLTLGGANVGTTGLDTYTGNVSGSGVTLSGATGPILTVSVINPGSNIAALQYYSIAGGSGSGASTFVSDASTPRFTFGNPTWGNGYRVGDVITVVNPYVGNTYSNATLVVTGLYAKPAPSIFVGNTAWSFSADGELTTPGNILLPDSTAIYNEDENTAVFTSNILSDTTGVSLTDGGNASVYVGGNTWTFDPSGTTTFPGDTTIDVNGDISAGNIDVYAVTTDTVSLGSTELYGSSGTVVFSETTVSTTVGSQYWGFNPYGITWFYVANSTNVQVGMQIYWAGYLIGSVTGVTSGNVSCTPLTATPNFVANSTVSFGNLASLATDTISSPTGNVSIEGNVSTGNVSVTGNITVLQWLNAAPSGNLNIGSPVRHNSNVTVLQYLNGPPSANLNISSGSGQPIRLLANAGTKAWAFNSNGSVTFPDNTLQTSGYPGQLYGNAQVNTYLPTYSGNIGGILVTNPMVVFGNITAGFAFPTVSFANVIFTGGGLANGYAQLNIQNIDSVGTQNSADFIATAPDGTDTSKYIDMGINGNNYSSSSWTVSGKNDGYVYINSGNLTLGTDTPNTTVKVHVGGTLAANVVATFSNSNVTIGGNLIVSNTYVPTANNSVGTKGQISYDSSYIYICIAANTWRRANLAIW